MASNIDPRYSCQVALPGFGQAAQSALANARVLVVGMGGLGCPVAQYLVGTGVGTIGLMDGDTVSVRNLHRQILYTSQEAGQFKALIAAQKLSLQNPEITITPIVDSICEGNALQIIGKYDLVVDCTDNFEARYLINDACVILGKPLVYGAIYQYEGQVALFNAPIQSGLRSPNYRDIFKEVDPFMVPDCSQGGVLPTLAGTIGLIMANEAIKYITNTGDSLAGKLLLYNSLTLAMEIVGIGKVSKTNITKLQEPPQVVMIEFDTLNHDWGNYLLVDVRNDDERQAINYGGLHIPLQELSVRVNEIPTEKPIVFYCASGARSKSAAILFSRQRPGVNAYSLKGGLGA
jgi:adenylyltransferase/sulfurtransferase